MFRFHHSAMILQDLIILGAGAAGISSLVSIIEAFKHRYPDGMPCALKITILEKSKKINGGYPYDLETQSPILRLNEPMNDMMLDIDRTDDFLAWLKENGENLKGQYPEIEQIIEDNIRGKDRYASRIMFGLYCRKRLADYTTEAAKLGITVQVKTDVLVTDIVQDLQENWYLKTKDKTNYSCKNLLIATGHMPGEKFASLRDKPGYLDTPYRDLSKVPNAPVFILGTALSAVDTTKLLAANNHSAPIYMISPSGQLPRVKGPATTYSYKMKHLTNENLSKPNIRLNEILDLFTNEVKHATKDDSWTIEKILHVAKQEKKDPRTLLHHEIATVESNTIRPWQLMLSQIWADPIALIWEHLDNRDRQVFAAEYFPLFQKWAAGMVYPNAKDLAALMDKGQLQVIASRNEVKFNSESGLFELKVNGEKTITAKSVINATGTGESIQLNDTLYAMRKRSLVKQAQYFGGLHLTTDFKLICPSDNNARQNAWAVGYVTVGSNIGASSMEQAAHDAKIIAAAVTDKLLRDNNCLTITPQSHI